MKIKLTEEQAWDFVAEGTEDFEYVEAIDDYDSLYKDSLNCKTICKQKSTGKHFALDWSKYVSHYGQGESELQGTEIYEVEESQVVKVTTEWRAV